MTETVEAHGRLVVGERGELMVELDDQNAVESLSSALSKRFEDQVFLCP